jgi:pimeloyl-ACP methyl ester carboxylesterase
LPDAVLRDPVTIRDGGTTVVGTLRDGGRATAVLIVHGIVGSRRMPEIESLAAELASRHDTLAIDVQGHGDGPGRFTWGRDEWKQVVAAAAWLTQGGREVAAIGFSFGGYHVAKAAARGAPLARIVLVGAPADLLVFDHVPLPRDVLAHLPLMLRRRRKLPRCERLPRLREREIGDEELARIAIPALVVHGGADWLVLRRHAERYAARLRAARLLEIPGGLHAEYLVSSHREPFSRAVGDFLGAAWTVLP